jgi:hypothetical protein
VATEKEQKKNLVELVMERVIEKEREVIEKDKVRKEG